MPEYQTSLFIEFDDDFTPLKIILGGTTYTVQEFLTNVCTINQEAQNVCNEIADKYIKLKEKTLQDRAIQAFIDSCVGDIESNQCVQYSVQSVTYEQAVQALEQPLYSYKEVTRQRLNESLQVETYTVTERDIVIGTRTVYQFRDACSWNENTGYQCRVREVLDTL